MTYDEIISWIRNEMGRTGFSYDIFSLDDVKGFRQALIDEYDKDNRLRHFLEGNPHSTKYMTEKGRFRWTGLEGSSAEEDWNRELERPIINELNRDIEQQITGQIGEADTVDEIDDIDVPDNLMPDVVERLESTRTERFGELKGEELRREIESPSTEVSRLNQLIREIRKLPDEDIQRDLKREIKEETRRLGDLNQFFIREIRSTGSEANLDEVINRIDESDLRNKQKDSLRRIADARRNLGFPELSEV